MRKFVLPLFVSVAWLAVSVSGASATLVVTMADILISSIKTDTTTTLDACKESGGKVVTKDGKQYCELPASKASNGSSR